MIPILTHLSQESLGQEDPLEEGLATHSSILAWRIHGQRSLVGYSPLDYKAWLLQLSTHTDGAWWYCMVWFLTGLLKCNWCPISGETLFNITTHWAHMLSYVWVFVTPWTVCSLPGSSAHEIFQAIVLEWTAISFSRGSFQPRDGIPVSCISDRSFTILSHLKMD